MHHAIIGKRLIQRTRLSIVAAFYLILALSINAQSISPTENPKKEDDSAIVLDKYISVGSRIKRLDQESVSPVTTIHSSDLQTTGFTTVADAIRALPFNSGQALTPTDAGTSFTPGVNSFNLRGLGNNNTLVLINGRRAVPYAVPGFNGFQTVFDLNSIPDAALDSIEILKDGGSALYGSDAVAGVVDFRLKQTYEGVFTSLEIGDYFDTNGMTKKFALITGAKDGKTSIFFAFSARTQESVYARDLSYTRNADKTEFASSVPARYISAGGAASWKADGLTDPYKDAVDLGWLDNRSGTGFPGKVRVTGTTYTFASPTNTPTVAGATTDVPLYNFQERAGLFPSSRDGSFFSSIKHDFNDFVYARVEASFTRAHSNNDAAPTPVVLASEHGLDTGSKMTIPLYNIYNPWGVDITSGNRRLVELGNRINDVTSDTPRVLLVLGGKLPSTDLFEDWTWETGATYSKNEVSNMNRNSVADYKMQQALNGLTSDGKGGLSWNPATPIAQRVYFNWFGRNSDSFTRFLASDNPTSASLEYENFDFQATGTLFHLPAGPLGIAIGGEHRNEKLAVVVSDLNQSGNIIGGAQSTSSNGSRQVNSVYAEANIPAFKWLEFLAAGRFEKYSDKDFEQRVRPKFGVKVRPLDWLILRASYSQSFKAPDLAFLYSGGTTTFTSTTYADPVNPTQPKVQIQVQTSGNPLLKPETTDTYYAGFTLEPSKGPMKGISASFDYFVMKQKNLLAQLTDFYTYTDYLTKAKAGDPLFASRVVRDPVTQQLLYIADSYGNLGDSEYRGWDYELAYVFDSRIGRLRTSTAGTYINKYTLNGSQIAGTALNARFNGNAGLTWSLHNWGASIFAVYRGVRHASFDLGELNSGDELFLDYDIKPQTTVNVSVSYDALWNTKVTVGVDNVFNKNPPIDPTSQDGGTDGVNALEPSFWFVRLEKHF